MFLIPNVSICPFYNFIRGTSPIGHRNALGWVVPGSSKGKRRDRLRLASGLWLASLRRARTMLWDGGGHRGSIHGPKWDEKSVSGEPGVTRPVLACGLKQEATEGFRGYSRIEMVTSESTYGTIRRKNSVMNGGRFSQRQIFGFGNRTRDGTQHCASWLHGCMAASEILNISTISTAMVESKQRDKSVGFIRHRVRRPSNSTLPYSMFNAQHIGT